MIKPWVDGVCARNPAEFGSAWIHADASTGHLQIWCVWDTETARVTAIAGTQINTGLDGLVYIKVLFCSGDGMANWVDLIAEIEEWGRSKGAVRMKGMMRPGWERHLGRRGYRRTHVMLEKDL